MPSFKDALRTVVDEGIAPVLKEHGLRKSGRNFWLPGDGVYGIVNVQASTFGARRQPLHAEPRRRAHALAEHDDRLGRRAAARVRLP